MPETAVAHHRDRTTLVAHVERGGASGTESIPHDGAAEVERREGRKRVAADVGTDIDRAELALEELDRGKQRSLRTADAEARWPRRHDGLEARQRDRRRGRCGGRQRIGQPLPQKRFDAGFDCTGGILAGHRKGPLPDHPGLEAGLAEELIDRLLDELRLTLFDHENRLLAAGESGQFFWDQRIGHVHHVERNVALAKGIGEAQILERSEHGVVESALEHDSDVRASPVEKLIQMMPRDVLDRRGPPRRDLVLLLEVGGRREDNPVVAPFRLIESILNGKAGPDIVRRHETAMDVTSPNPEHQHHRRIAGFGEIEAGLHHRDDRRQIGTRIEEPHL